MGRAPVDGSLNAVSKANDGAYCKDAIVFGKDQKQLEDWSLARGRWSG